jgi:hypothetical protein
MASSKVNLRSLGPFTLGAIPFQTVERTISQRRRGGEQGIGRYAPILLSIETGREKRIVAVTRSVTAGRAAEGSGQAEDEG